MSATLGPWGLGWPFSDSSWQIWMVMLTIWGVEVAIMGLILTLLGVAFGHFGASRAHLGGYAFPRLSCCSFQV